MSHLTTNAIPRNQVMQTITTQYLSQYTKDNHPEPKDIEKELVQLIKNEFLVVNTAQDKSTRWAIPSSLPPAVIADVMAALYHIYRVPLAGPDADSDTNVLAIYQQNNERHGTYSIKKEDFYCIAKQYNYTLSSKDFDEIYFQLEQSVPVRQLCSDPNIIPVNNGLFNHATKTLMPFNPEHVFLSKPHVNYSPVARPVVIHDDSDNTDWDVDSWLADIADNDDEILDLLWKTVGACLRPNVSWNKSVWLYSTAGNNGKGTLCAMIRALLGPNAHTSIKLSEFGKDFMLEGIIQKQAIITDENDVNIFIDQAANLKAVITNDVIQINRKYKVPISYRFRGLMIQCINDLPKIKDKSNSLYRRMIVIPMMKTFTGIEKTYIKSDYLKRKDVLEYVLHKVLNMDYDKLPEPEQCKRLLEEYKEYNDTVRQFFVEFRSKFQWDLLPFKFLYDLYKAWFKQNVPSGTLQSRNTFINDVLEVVQQDNVWTCPNRRRVYRTAGRMSRPEPLVLQYGLEDWMNNYKGADKLLAARPVAENSYRGLIRISTMSDDDKLPEIEPVPEE